MPRARQWLGTAVWVPHRDFFKEGSRGMAEHGTHMHVQLPCQQRGQSQSTVCAHGTQLARKRRRLHDKGIAGLHPAWLVSRGCAQNKSFGSETPVRAVSQDLDRLELGT